MFNKLNSMWKRYLLKVLSEIEVKDSSVFPLKEEGKLLIGQESSYNSLEFVRIEGRCKIKDKMPHKVR